MCLLRHWPEWLCIINRRITRSTFTRTIAGIARALQHRLDATGIDALALLRRVKLEKMMLTKPVLIAVLMTAAVSALPGPARAAETANLTGTYRCEPDPAPCRSGQTLTVTQSGAQIEFKSDSGFVGHANITSNISLSGVPTWNSLGIVTPDRSIEWSNGTKWRKQ